MILSRGRRYIFVHAPKTGGTSLAVMLEGKAMADDILVGDTPKAVKRRNRLSGVETSGRLWKHSKLSDLYGLVTQDEMEDFFVFTLVRNPWDRVVSYYHWLRAQSFDHPAVAVARSQGFSEFVRDPVVMKSLAANPYGSYVTDGQGAERANLFLRLERLADDLVAVESALGTTFHDIPHENASNRVQDYRVYYDDSTAEAVAKACAEDITRFGYRFDPGS